MSPGRAWRVPADWPGGVRHEGDASLVCCGCMERGKADADMVGLVPEVSAWVGERERVKRREP